MSAEYQVWFGPGAGDKVPGLAPRGVAPSKMPAARVLIVEDELFVAWHLETLAREFGLEVVGLVPDGESAIEQATDAAPDLLLMDINLGGRIDGIETARRICARQDIAVIFITAFADAGTLGRIRQAIPDAIVLPKPISADRLRDAIGKALDGRAR